MFSNFFFYKKWKHNFNANKLAGDKKVFLWANEILFHDNNIYARTFLHAFEMVPKGTIIKNKWKKVGFNIFVMMQFS